MRSTSHVMDTKAVGQNQPNHVAIDIVSMSPCGRSFPATNAHAKFSAQPAAIATAAATKPFKGERVLNHQNSTAGTIKLAIKSAVGAKFSMVSPNAN